MLPRFGPHDEDMSVHEWFDVTLKCLANDKEEEIEFHNFVSLLRQQFKVFDVAPLMQLTRLQLEQGASQAVGEQGKRGLVRMVCKFLGTEGCPHNPPLALESDAMGCPQQVEEQKVQFGRLGKGGCNSTESNFPEAMVPSRHAKTLNADDIKLPCGLQQWMQQKCAPFNKDHRMPRDVTVEITRTVGDWIISMFGCSPVSVCCS